MYLCSGEDETIMDEEFYKNIERLLKLEQESAETNSQLLQEMMDRGVRDIDQLDRVADRLYDTMYGLTGAGEEMYRKYLDYMATFNAAEAEKRRDRLEYDLGYKTHVLYAAALLCQKELENCTAPDGRSSFQVVKEDYLTKVSEFKKETATFLFFAHYAKGRPVFELMHELRTITEETDFVMEHIDEFDDLMHYPNETYHPLREDEWQLLQYIAEHNIELCDKNLEENKEMFHLVFGR